MKGDLRHLLSTRDLDVETVETLLARTGTLKRLRGLLSIHERALTGDTVVNLFWEPSTRARVSFELAAQRLGAHVINLSPKEASMAKGESLEDTVASLRAMGCRFFVVRHGTSGEIERLAAKAGRGMSLVNAGDGTNEHPCQALVDLFTLRERKKNLQGLKLAILGDLLRSRVAHSNLHLLSKFGVRIAAAGPRELLPDDLGVPGAEIAPTVDDAVRDADAVMVLRLQRERGGIHFGLPESEYRDRFGLTAGRLALAKPDAIVLHPGPMLRGQEIDSDVADGAQSVVLRQAENGLFMRMAIFEALRGTAG
jgi:aspartate carbamoyltransferase catalytic subunit